MTDDIEVRLKHEQWTTLANMLARDVQAAGMREAVLACRNDGCAMSRPAAKWATLLRTGERLAKHADEWRALGDITAIVGRAVCAAAR